MKEKDKMLVIETIKKLDLTDSMGILYEMEYIEEKTRRKLNKIRKEKVENAKLKLKEIKEKITLYEVSENKEELEIIKNIFIEENEMKKKKVIIHTNRMGFLMIEEGQEGHFALENIKNGEWSMIFVDEQIVEKKEEINLLKEIIKIQKQKAQ